MKANTLQSLWIIVCSIKTTVFYLIKTLWNVKKGSRAGVDQVTRDWSEHLFKHIKLSYKIINTHAVQLQPHRAYIIMSNHESLYDIPLIFVSLHGSIRMIAKKELFRVPLFGYVLKHANFIFIDRQNTQQAVKDLEKAKKEMEDGIVLWIAPEGTRSRDGKLGKFKKGAFMLALQTGATIIPVGIRGSRNILPPKTTEFHLNQKVEMHIGEPVDTHQYTIETRDQLIQTVRKQIEELSGVGD